MNRRSGSYAYAVETLLQFMKKNTFKPIGDRVLIQREPPRTQTPGGLHLPQNIVDQSNQARVLAAGPKAKDVKPGDTILLANGGFFSPIELNGERCELIAQKDIVAVIEED